MVSQSIHRQYGRRIGHRRRSNLWPGTGFGAVNTDVTEIGGKLFALVEAGELPIELGEDLESLRRSDLNGTLQGGFTAHPKFDPQTGEMLALCYRLGQGEVRHEPMIRPERARLHTTITGAIVQT